MYLEKSAVLLYSVSMGTITFDTHAYVKRLKAAGFNEEQAEALSSAQKEAIDNALVTKHDMQKELEPIKLDLVELKGVLALHGWMLRLVIAGIAALILKAFFI